MSLGPRDLEQIMTLFEKSNFTELKLESGDLKLHLRKGATAAREIETPAPAHEPVVVAPSVPVAHALPPLGPGEIDTPSPLLGVFYRAPKPGEPPFVEVGQAVEAETIIGIVEVMKLMNSVRAGTKGVIVAIHAPNAELVEYEQPLIRVRTIPPTKGS